MLSAMLPFAVSEFATTLILVAPATYLLLVGLGRWLKRRARLSLGASYQILSLALAFFVPLCFLDPDPLLFRLLATVVVLTGTGFGLALLQRFGWEYYFHERCQTPVPKYLQDVAAIVAYLLAAVTTLTFIYDVRIPGLLAGSGMVAAILGLAMQDTLGNIMAGFALHLGQPFKPGDWLMVESRHAEVIEINWRSTRLRTTDNTYFDIPNTQLNKQVLVNLSYPDSTHAMRLSVAAEYQAPPNEVKAALLHAAGQAQGVRAQPPPRAFLAGFSDSAILYDVKFWLDDPAQFNDITDAIRTNIWYEFQRRHLKMPTQLRTVQLAKAPREAARDAIPTDLLRHQPVFQCLEEDERSQLLASSKLLRFGKGERIITQNEEGDSMFILVRGAVSVYVSRSGKSTQVASLHAGDCFGEISLLTGAPRSATVVAQTDCDILEIEKPFVAALLQQRPELSRSLSELLARRQMETEDSLADSARPLASDTERVRRRESIEGWLAKITRFFEL